MSEAHSLETLKDIRRIMDRSSRFISLSGLSGISAGIFALAGAFIAWPYVYGRKDLYIADGTSFFSGQSAGLSAVLNTWIFWIALATFLCAFVSAFFFTWLKSRKQGIPLWGKTAKRLMLQVAIPMAAGGLFLLKLAQFGTFGLIAPGCLIFYGLALINASRYTLDEIRYLGYTEVLLGLAGMWFVGYGLYFWAAGFGVFHIVYGAFMWWKYEKQPQTD